VGHFVIDCEMLKNHYRIVRVAGNSVPAGKPQMAGSRASTAFFRKIAFLPAARGKAASVLAAGVLLAQVLAAAHVHPWSYSGITSRATHPVVTDAACAVCILHAHAPVCAAAVPTLPQPTICAGRVACPALPGAFCAPKSQRFGRAPPVFA
jgi:hypothetical protein